MSETNTPDPPRTISPDIYYSVSCDVPSCSTIVLSSTNYSVIASLASITVTSTKDQSSEDPSGNPRQRTRPQTDEPRSIHRS